MPSKPLARKAARQQKRQAKAEGKRQHYLAHKRKPVASVPAPRPQKRHAALVRAPAAQAFETADPDDAEIARLERLLRGNVADATFHPDMVDFLREDAPGPNNNNDDDDDDDHDAQNAEANETVYITKSRNLYGSKSVLFDHDATAQDADAVQDANVPVQRIKSALNRVTRETLAPTMKELLAVYAQASSKDVTRVLVKHVCESASAPLSPIFAALVASLDLRLRSSAIGSALLEELVRLFESGQGTFNHAVLVAHCCAMGVAHEQLLLDLAQVLVAKDMGKALVAMLDEAGARMRKAAPALYKSILQSYTGPSNVAAHITAKKTDYEAAEARLRPLVKFVRHERGETPAAPLRASYDDLAQAEAKGRWWVVGGKWENGARATVLGETGAGEGAVAEALKRAPPRLLAAAMAQGMNTDVRKAVFCALMGAADAVSALDALLRLGLSELQEREAVRVLLHVCGVAGAGDQTRFFALVCDRLVAAKPRVRFSLQLAFWDAFKQLSESRATERLARLLAALVSRQVLSLSTLKPVDFVRLGDGTLAFLRAFFDALLMQSHQPLREDDVLVASVFARLQGAGEAAGIRDGILVFWSRVEPFASASGLLRKRLVIAKRVLGFFIRDGDDGDDGDDAGVEPVTGGGGGGGGGYDDDDNQRR